MDSFKNYVISEYRVEGFTSVSFKFTHSLSTKLDKKSGKELNNHAINVTVQFFDKDLNLLRKSSLKFVNNVLGKKQASELVNISPKELENRFNAARREIVGEILKEYMEKKALIDAKMFDLRLY